MSIGVLPAICCWIWVGAGAEPVPSPASDTAGRAAAAENGEQLPPLPELTPGPAITLAEALAEAERRNLSYQAAQADVDAARADLKVAWSYLHPTAAATLNAVRNDHADVVSLGGGQDVEVSPQQTMSGRIEVAVPLIYPKAWADLRAAYASVDVARWSSEQLRQEILLSVAEAYYAALASRELIDVEVAQIRAAGRHLAIARVRHRSGTGSRLDVVRARTEWLQAREQLIQANTDLDNYRDALAVLIRAGGLPMPVPVADVEEPALGVQQLTDRAVQEREDLKVQRGLVRLADRQVTAAWMELLPTLGASWQLDQTITNPGDFASPDKSRWFLGLTLSVPIYSYRRYGDLDRSRAALSKATLQAEEAELTARRQVRESYRSWREAVALAATAEEQARLAQETLRLTETAYETGTGSSLDVTDAQRTSRQAETNLAARRFTTQLALLRLLRAVGTDVTTLVEAPAAQSESR